jgi:branched-chain amino acid transport system ATP-binding protein
MSSARPTLTARGVDKHFGYLHVTRSVDIEVTSGAIHALIGPNGAGKTTLLAQLSGELASDSGTVHFDGADITHVDMPGRVHLGVSRSFQTSSPFPDFTVRENVLLALMGSDHGVGLFIRAGVDRRRNRLAAELLGHVGLNADPSTPVTELDHGAIRQLEIAMVLASAPSMLLLDEPMAGLAPAEIETMSALFSQLRADHGILLVEHDMDVVFSLADRVTVISDGEILASGTPGEIRADERVQALYLRGSET